MTPADEAAGVSDPGVTSVTSGWGTLSSGGSSPDQLQAVAVPIVSNAEAAAAYGSRNITDDMIGAGIIGVGGKDACQGDSGGPLVVQVGNTVKVAGITSWGNGCALPDFPGMYARVASFDSFISSFVGAQPSSNVAPPALFSGATSSALASSTIEGSVERTLQPVEGLTVSPNPATFGETTISFFAGSFGADLDLQIIDMTGRVVDSKSWYNARGNVSYNANLSGLNKGIYLVQINGNDFSETSKLIVK